MLARPPERSLILGAGVAGLRVAKRFGRRLKPSESRIMQIDENDCHQLLYQIHEVCNLEYEEKEIIYSLSRILSKRMDFCQPSVQNIDPEGKSATSDKSDIPYDICFIALRKITTKEYPRASALQREITHQFRRYKNEKGNPI